MKNGGPRPTRTATQPWGIAGVTGKERRALALGSMLMRATIELLYVAASAGISFVFEHPAEADWVPESASAWKLLEMLHAFSSIGVQQDPGPPV